jgi:putative ABC transport system permease protein
MDGTTRRELHLVQLLVSLLLVVVSVNIAVLVYARMAMRRGEIAVRSALGASRRRIVAQLFAEALVLSAGAVVVGLALTALALGWVDAVLAQVAGLPFWVDFGLSPGTLLYVLGLALLGAVIVGVVPALQATGRRMQSSLRQLGGGTGVQLGRTWTVLIVAQVAFAVAVLPAALFMGSGWLRYGFAEPGFAAEEFLTADLQMDRESPPSAEAGPGVFGATFAMQNPGDEPAAWVEVEGVAAPAGPESTYSLGAGSRSGHQVRLLRVADDFFDTFVPILAGRQFEPADLGAAATGVIVNRSFVQQIPGDGTALGRRIRYVGRGADAPDDMELGRWYEIVGVASDFPNAMAPGQVQARLYHAVAPGRMHPVNLTVRMRGVAPASFAPRLREITAALDPTLQLRGVRSLDEVMRKQQEGMRMGALAIALVTLSVLLLSAAGIYALISFTVTRRRREIGIRAALGAHPRRILRSIFSRALGQLALGLVVGAAAAALLDRLSEGELMGGKGIVVLPIVAALMLGVGLLAALGPARRGLRIQPTEALRADG